MASRNTPGLSSPHLTKQQRQQQAREKARLLQQAEAKRAKRTRLFVALGSSFAVILVVAAVVFVIWNGTKKKGEEVKPKVSPSANVSADGVISVGKGFSEGTTRAGAKNADKPRVRIYSDYACTHCNDLEKEYGNKLVNLASKGEITLEVVPLSVLRQKFSDVASQADYYIAEKAPQYYAAFHTKYFADVSAPIFARQKGIPSQYKKVALDVAKKVGVPDDVLKGLDSALSKNRYGSFLQYAAKKFADAGHQGTPTVTINGRRLEDWTEGKLLTELEKVAGHKLEASDAEPATPKTSEKESTTPKG